MNNILRAGVQPKLKIGAVNDPAEVEADRVADQVMRMPTPANDSTAISTQAKSSDVNRKCTDCGDEEKVRRKEMPDIRMKETGGTGGHTASAEASSAINSLGSGSPLPASERAFFEPRFGQDLSHIRVHTGGTADAASQSINARAFSLGNNIAFANGEFQPGTHTGRSLMAHEITHTLQGGQGVNRVVRRFVEYSPKQQKDGNSLGWTHPGSKPLRVSNSGELAVEQNGWGANLNKFAWCTDEQLAQSNKILKAINSEVELEKKSGNDIRGVSPDKTSKKQKALFQVVPKDPAGISPFSMTGDCGTACKEVMGSKSRNDVAVLGQGDKRQFTSAGHYHGGSPTTPQEFFLEILKKAYGAGHSDQDLYKKYEALNTSEKKKFDSKYGINENALPEVGQGLTISTESLMPSYTSIAGFSTWNFHYAGAVFKSKMDYVTLESAAGWGSSDWIFYMYGNDTPAGSFHEEHGNSNTHGNQYSTMVVQPEKRLIGKTNSEGVHLVRSPQDWDTTRIAKLKKGSDVYITKTIKRWYKIKVMSGPHAGKTGWIVKSYFDETP